MKIVNWTCDICNPKGLVQDRGFIHDGPTSYRDVEAKHGWRMRYQCHNRKVKVWPSMHVCTACLAEGK